MSLQLGPHQLDALETAPFALDGGALFGVVPKAQWERKLAADAQNEVPQAARCLLVRTGRRVVLVGTGTGVSDDALAQAGVGREEITDVILSHLQLQHAGGLSRVASDGTRSLAFPRATFHLQRRHWAWAHHPSERDEDTFRPEDLALLQHGGRLHLVEGETELFPGVHLLLSEGHTVGMQLVRVQHDEQWLTTCAALVPTRFHLRSGWAAASDLYPLTIIEEKKMLVAEAIEDGGILFFEHDPNMQACRVREESGDVVAEKVSLS